MAYRKAIDNNGIVRDRPEYWYMIEDLQPGEEVRLMSKGEQLFMPYYDLRDKTDFDSYDNYCKRWRADCSKIMHNEVFVVVEHDTSYDGSPITLVESKVDKRKGWVFTAIFQRADDWYIPLKNSAIPEENFVE